MKWLWKTGEKNFENCVELKIDVENRKFTVNYYFNHPMGGGGNSETFDFEEAKSEKFHRLIEYQGNESFDTTFGEGAEEEFYSILKMNRVQYDAQNLENKEIIIDRQVS